MHILRKLKGSDVRVYCALKYLTDLGKPEIYRSNITRACGVTRIHISRSMNKLRRLDIVHYNTIKTLKKDDKGQYIRGSDKTRYVNIKILFDIISSTSIEQLNKPFNCAIEQAVELPQQLNKQFNCPPQMKEIIEQEVQLPQQLNKAYPPFFQKEGTKNNVQLQKEVEESIKEEPIKEINLEAQAPQEGSQVANGRDLTPLNSKRMLREEITSKHKDFLDSLPEEMREDFIRNMENDD